MKLEDFNYELPEKFIAQTPIKDRDKSKLMILSKDTGEIKHEVFCNVVDYLEEGDCLVLNNTKVLPARIYGTKVDTGAKIEFLLHKNIDGDNWECMARPLKRLKVGNIVKFNDKLSLEVIDKKDELVYVKFIYNGIFNEILNEVGIMPLPPYIHEKLEDKNRYQTVYARHDGSAAAPTAGLHFTNELLEKIKEKNIKVVYVTLHVGLGTFKPVDVDDILSHHMHEEEYFISSEVANVLNDTKKSGKNIIAVGTTSTRVLETVVNKYGCFKEDSGVTDIFIYPGYEFKGIDGLITNFHLPKSTLLMLVSALSKREYILNAYERAKENNYRFFSFGDAMFIKK